MNSERSLRKRSWNSEKKLGKSYESIFAMYDDDLLVASSLKFDIVHPILSKAWRFFWGFRIPGCYLTARCGLLSSVLPWDPSVSFLQWLLFYSPNITLPWKLLHEAYRLPDCTKPCRKYFLLWNPPSSSRLPQWGPGYFSVTEKQWYQLLLLTSLIKFLTI